MAAASTPASAPQIQDLQVSLATPAQIPSLTTIVPRAFHKTNAFHRAAIPNTPLVRQWYERIFADEIQDPTCHVLTVVVADDDANDQIQKQNSGKAAKRTVLGVLCLRLMTAADKDSSGIWTRHAITADHDRAKFEAMAAPMAGPRARIMGDAEHFLLELFGVDDEVKGMGLGGKLLRRACEICDEKGVDCFVEANVFSVGFYQRFGFEVREEIVLAGGEDGEDYGEALLVYSCRGSGWGGEAVF